MVRTVEVMGGKTRLVSIMFNLKTEDNSVFVFNYDQVITDKDSRDYAEGREMVLQRVPERTWEDAQLRRNVILIELLGHTLGQTLQCFPARLQPTRQSR